MAIQFAPALSPFSDDAVRLMFEARKRVFVDILKWEVPVLDDRFEMDQFDTLEADYLIITDERQKHMASTRLLRTESAHILGDLFACLCDGELPRGPATREITRFCIEPTLGRTERRKARNQLVTAVVEHALAHGITDYTAVANMAWYRQISSFGWKCRTLGPSQSVNGETLVALHIEIDAQTRHQLTQKGIYCFSAFRSIDAGVLQ